MKHLHCFGKNKIHVHGQAMKLIQCYKPMLPRFFFLSCIIYSYLCRLRWNGIKVFHILPDQNPPSPLLTGSIRQCFKETNSTNLWSESLKSQVFISVVQQEIYTWSLSQIAGTKLLEALGSPEWCVFCVLVTWLVLRAPRYLQDGGWSPERPIMIRRLELPIPSPSLG